MFKCEECEANLVEDHRLTCGHYDDNVTVILDEDGHIKYESLPTELVFVCRRCGFSKLIDINDLIKYSQERIANTLLNLRMDFVYKNADKDSVDEANGVDFCGICPGVIDDSGYCYKDVILQCPIRKAKLSKNET